MNECEKCDLKFDKTSQLIIHMVDNHSGMVVYWTDAICGHRFKEGWQLANHLMRVHEREENEDTTVQHART